MKKEKIKELIIQHKEKFISKTDFIIRKIQRRFENFLKSRDAILIADIEKD